MSLVGRLIRPDELVLLLLGAGAGMLWALLSLVLGTSPFLVHASGGLRAAVMVLNLALYLAGWVASTLHLTVIDPSAVVVTVAVTVTLVPIAIWLGSERRRERS